MRLKKDINCPKLTQRHRARNTKYLRETFSLEFPYLQLRSLQIKFLPIWLISEQDRYEAEARAHCHNYGCPDNPFDWAESATSAATGHGAYGEWWWRIICYSPEKRQLGSTKMNLIYFIFYLCTLTWNSTLFASFLKWYSFSTGSLHDLLNNDTILLEGEVIMGLLRFSRHCIQFLWNVFRANMLLSIQYFLRFYELNSIFYWLWRSQGRH